MISDISSFENFVASQSVHVSLPGFIMNLGLTLILAIILEALYVRYGKSLSNRAMFARNFLILAATTMFIISVVKSSLALSLGLVGALSIVRFRTAIKEPEELGYLFLCIAVGLGLGANQVTITLVAFCLIAVCLVIKSTSSQPSFASHLLITFTSEDDEIGVQVVEIIKDYSSSAAMKRWNQAVSGSEMFFECSVSSFKKLVELRTTLKKLDPTLHVQFLES